MLQEVWSNISWALGLELEGKDLDVWRMALRALIVFVVAIAMIRLGNKRFMGKNTALDVMLGIVFGSLISRAITGNAPFFPTLAAGLVLVASHWALSAIAFHWKGFGALIKGDERTLIRDGEIQWNEMRKAHITEKDLKEALRNNGKLDDPSEVKVALLERNGDISVIPRR
jgi:uncharacterized membrane protein YcaP (DUF421 family)